ncbi:MAG: thermonuclease family protein [Gammaproteobacteria bacterium]|nr:thermonuclease family protein [Gammaproteobacteria bacterium]MCK5262503.1 thermonuclease family protein [Gammaproteobacteria bacterium]
MARNSLSLIVLNTKKSAIWRFFLLYLFCAPSLATADNCPDQYYDESATVKYVHDGDTVKLVDGRIIRLIGINAPEVARDGQPAEAYALEARDYLHSLLAKHNNRIQLIHGKETKDHYQRLLSHLFLPDGTNLQARLLSSGLVAAITIPPNNRFSDCYRKIEKHAFCKKKGLWSHEILNLAELNDSTSGFHVLKAQLQSIQSYRKGLWLTLKHGLSLRIATQHLALFDQQQLQSLIGQAVIIKGWLQTKKNPKQGERFYMQIKHPSAIEEEKKVLKC